MRRKSNTGAISLLRLAFVQACPKEPSYCRYDAKRDKEIEPMQRAPKYRVRVPILAKYKSDVGQAKAPRPRTRECVELEL